MHGLKIFKIFFINCDKYQVKVTYVHLLCPPVSFSESTNTIYEYKEKRNDRNIKYAS